MKKSFFLALIVVMTSGANAQESFTLEECRALKLLPEAKIAELELAHFQAIKNPTPQMSFTLTFPFPPIVGPDTSKEFYNYNGSTSPGADQIMEQFGDIDSSMMSALYSVYTSGASGQVSFAHHNLKTSYPVGHQYRFRAATFESAPGVVTFYPSASGFYYLTTVAMAKASVVAISLSCDKKKAYFYRDNNGPAVLSGTVSTLQDPTYAATHGVILPISKTATNSVPVLDSINLSANMVSTDTITDYVLELEISMGSNPLDTMYDACTKNTTAVDELEAKKSFKIFPNPVVDQATVFSITEGNLTVSDAMGRRVMNEKILTGQTVLRHTDISPGIYFYEFSDKEGKLIKTDKIMFAGH